MIRILLFDGRGLVSNAISRFTRSTDGYSHAAFMMKDGSVWEAWADGQTVLARLPIVRKTKWGQAHQGGVRHLPGLKHGTQGVDAYLLKDPLTEEEYDRLEGWLKAHEGDRYSFGGVWGFVTRKRSDSSGIFCSELVFDGLLECPRWLFERTEGWEVSPDLIKRSPLIYPDPNWK